MSGVRRAPFLIGRIATVRFALLLRGCFAFNACTRSGQCVVTVGSQCQILRTIILMRKMTSGFLPPSNFKRLNRSPRSGAWAASPAKSATSVTLGSFSSPTTTAGHSFVVRNGYFPTVRSWKRRLSRNRAESSRAGGIVIEFDQSTGGASNFRSLMLGCMCGHRGIRPVRYRASYGGWGKHPQLTRGWWRGPK